ncbi:MAG: efflux RND transporter periplasmic adaptor subunit, partial [Flavobacterium sp.]
EGNTVAQKLKNTPEVSLLLVDGSEYEIKGRLETVNGLVDPATGTTQFRAEFPNPQAVLRSGGSGIVRLPIETKNAIQVPQNAVFDMQGKQMIYVVNKDNTVKSKIIRTSATAGLNFIVAEGLEPGEVVVVEGASKLKDGMKIVPQQAQQPAVADASKKDTTKTVTQTK